VRRSLYVQGAKGNFFQAFKELTTKFIETYIISPGNFAEIFPMIYKVVSNVVPHNEASEEKHKGNT